MSDTWKGTTNNWFTAANWTGTAPTNTATGSQTLVVSGTTATQPEVLFSNGTEIDVAQTVITDGTTYNSTLLETQLGGEIITLTSNANFTIAGVAMGIFYGGNDTLTAGPTGGRNPTYSTITGLHGALSTTPSYDAHMQVSVVGNDTLTALTIDETFGLITIASGDTLTIDNAVGGNAQALHGLINYGLIQVSAGGTLNIIDETSTLTGTVANFYNAGWIVDNGGSLNISSTLLDGANTAASATTIDGYIIVEGGANATLSSTVGAQEEVVFSGSNNTLAITAGTLFAGTVANFGATDTIDVNGFTSTSNVTLTTVGGTPELITANGTVLTTITLAGTLSSLIVAGTNAAGQEYIESGSSVVSGGSGTLGAAGGTVTTSGGLTVSGAGTTLTTYDSLIGNGTITIQNGATFGLFSTAGNDGSIAVQFGALGSSSSPNTLIINDNTTGFGGTITGFSGNDVIDVGASVLPSLTSGEGLVYSYGTSGLTVTETNSAGSTVASTVLTIVGTGLSTASFVALDGSAGVTIELAPTVATGFTFTGATNANFELGANFASLTAPGDVLSGNESVTIAANTASVSSGGVTDNGLISVASGAGFVDGGSLVGTGSLVVTGSASLTGGTTLGGITDNGTLTLGGNDNTAITLGSGAQVTIAANFSDAKAITGAGTLTVKPNVTGSLAAGSSFAAINDSGTLVLGGSLGGPINMEGNGAGSAVYFTGTDLNGHVLGTSLTNFGTGDAITLGTPNISVSSGDVLTSLYSNGTLVVSDTTDGASVTIDVSLTSGDNPGWLKLADSSGALVITLCFCAGTHIATPEGEMAVERLREGDLVLTADGRAMPVRWLGQSHVAKAFADPVRSYPVRLSAGALGDGLPLRDLLVSPDHALFLDGVLVQAGALVNGVSITRESDVAEVFTYYHLELASHELLLAEGVAAESFVDNIERMHFHNWDARTAPSEAIAELPYPRAKSARQVPVRLRERLRVQGAA
jgi:hypothetical protein